MAKPRFSASVTVMFREFALLDRFQAAKDAGFDGVEIQDLDEGDPTEMARAARDAGTPVVLVNAGLGDFRQGGPGLSGVPGREAEFDGAISRALDAAGGLDARFIHVGPSRIPDGIDRAACIATYRRNLETALRRRQERQIDAVLLIEAVNTVDFPTVLIGELDQAAGLIDETDSGAVGLLFDIYHLAMGDRDLAGPFVAHQQLIRHVQFSNIPGRNEPEVGELDLVATFRRLIELGYLGWFGAEYFPQRPTLETLAWLRAPIM